MTWGEDTHTAHVCVCVCVGDKTLNKNTSRQFFTEKLRAFSQS